MFCLEDVKANMVGNHWIVSSKVRHLPHLLHSKYKTSFLEKAFGRVYSL
jgi:hypothetical protein